MRAWAVDQPGPIATHPLRPVDRPLPEPGAGEIRVRIAACGVCRTDLHLTEGDLAPRRPLTVPGHEIVGRVDALGPDVQLLSVGDRVGIAWLRFTCGRCRWCRRGQENLCPYARFTGWDTDGGYAEFAVVSEAFAYRLPDAFDDVTAAPLLCAGIVGYRALRQAECPPGGRLGIYGFGASAHLAAQVALHEGARVHVMTRADKARRLAADLGVASVQGAYDQPPEPLDAAVIFAPVGELVPVALAALDRGGTLSIAGIHLTDIPTLDYEQHVFYERTLRSTTANTRADGEEFLSLAAAMRLSVTTVPYPLDRAPDALADLAGDRITGAGVLVV